MQDMDRILVEVTNGKPPAKLDTPEQMAFRLRLIEEVKEIKRRGRIVEIPSEFPSAD